MPSVGRLLSRRSSQGTASIVRRHGAGSKPVAPPRDHRGHRPAGEGRYERMLPAGQNAYGCDIDRGSIDATGL